MKKLRLQGALHALVDDEDAFRALSYNWHAMFVTGRWPKVRAVATASKSGAKILLHRFIMDAKPGQIVDHINGDPLDNRRCNLRFCNASENAKNRGKTEKNTTGYKGVYRGHNGKFRTVVVSNGQAIRMSGFETPEQAHQAYCEKAKVLHGEFFRAN